MQNLLPVADNNFSTEKKWQNMCQKIQYCAICYPIVIFICIHKFDSNYEKPGHKVNIYISEIPLYFCNFVHWKYHFSSVTLHLRAASKWEYLFVVGAKPFAANRKF